MKILTPMIAATSITTTAIADTPNAPPQHPVTVKYEQICSPEKLVIYFGPNSAEVTKQSRTTLGAALDQFDDCAITHIRTTAISADTRQPDNFQTLSQARTDAVLEAFASAGVWANNVQTDLVLKRDTNRPDTAVEPMARRVEVELITVKAITS